VAVLAAALDAARPPGWGALREDPHRDRAVVTGILAGVVGVLIVAAFAAAGQRLFVAKMQSQKLAVIAAGGLVAIGAVPGALAALAALPLLRRIAKALPRPHALGATGVLLITMGVAAVLAFVAALSRADWRVLDLGPLYALAVAVVLAAGHGCSGSARAPAAGYARGCPPGSVRYSRLRSRSWRSFA
jgi:drug/metabolite transporter (DMT)-like permease